ncbi:MAG: S9 family peptidase [Peptostreptococcaceae bacterium]|nr:S9 family peptidase [Peptostreptococcaceae bacterium]
MGKIKKSDLLRMNFLSGLSFSADKKHLALSVSRAKEDKKGYESNIHLYDFEEKSWIQYTGSGKDRRFFWDIEKPSLYIMADRDAQEEEKRKEGHERTAFYELRMGKGEPVKKFVIRKNVGKIRQISSDLFLFTASIGQDEKELFKLDEKEAEQELKERKEEKDYEAIEEIPFWGNGEGFTHSRITKLYLYDASKDKLKILSDKLPEGITVTDFELNSGRDRLVVLYDRIRPKAELTSHFLVWDLKSKELIFDYKEEKYAFAKAFLKADGKVLALGSEMKDYGLNENMRLLCFDLEKGEEQEWIEYQDTSFWNSVGSDVRLYGGETIRYIDETLYFVSTRGYSSHLFAVGEDRSVRILIEGSGSVDEYALGTEGIYYIGLREMLPQEVYLKTAKAPSEENPYGRISSFNAYFAEKNRLVIPQHFTVKDQEGYEIDAWLMRPQEMKKGEKCPLILDIHGGPKTVYGEVYYHEMQYWASKGYAVVFCNPRGSDGKGNAFADIRGKYGDVDYKNLMQVVDEAVAKNDFIDENNLFVTGGSYGGFMTNWIVGHTDRFKAAATQRSIANWISMYGTTDIGYYFASDQTAGDPWEGHEAMWTQSPMKYLDRAVTPTLVIHSEEDYRCWLPEGIQMFTALKYHGVESRLVIFKGENHELTRSGRPDHRLRSMKEIFGWFRRFYKEEGRRKDRQPEDKKD